MRSPDLRRALAALAAAALAAGCVGSRSKDDPLKNTKKLAVSGHVSLYKNGAFRVPHSSVSLIPPGPSALELAGQLMGVRARQAFVKSVTQAAQSVVIVAEGTRKTYAAAKSVKAEGDADAAAIDKLARADATLLVLRSSRLGKRIAGKSWELGKAVLSTGKDAAKDAGAVGDKLGEAASAPGRELASSAISTAKDVSREAAERDKDVLKRGAQAFVKGYAVLPERLKRRKREAGEILAKARFGRLYQEQQDFRRHWSQKAVDLMVSTVKDYPSDVSGTLRKAGEEFDDSYRTTGVSLAALKSLRWVLQGLFGDATFEPAANLTAASLGYIGVNLVAFPSLVVAREGGAVTMLAAEVVWDGAKASYDITAPTGIAALAGLQALAETLGTQPTVASLAAAGAVLGYSEAALAKSAGVVVKAAGVAAGESVRYIGVPLASAGVVVGGGTIGTAVGAVGAASGGAVLVAGETGALTTKAFGNILSGATLAAGAAAAAGAGGGYGVYELSKAAIVPPGYELAGGIVLDYGTMSHLAAQTILAAADCSYLVLSLEGPRWVLYAVKGKKSSGEDMPAGAVVDLKAMHEAGEEIYNVPLSDAEMRGLVDSAYENLPTLPAKR